MRKLFTAAFIAAGLAAPALADSRFPPITDPEVKAACSECHMAFFPEFLPQASWRLMFGNLTNHFGEDASLEPAELERVTAYYLANASDVSKSRVARRWRKQVHAGEAPLRLTKLRRFTHEHGESSRQPKSFADCVSCHGDKAERGYFDD